MPTFLPRSCLFVKNILHCVVAKLNPSPAPTETGWLGFRVRCQLVLSGPLMCQLLLQHSFYFQSPGWFYTCFCIRKSGLGGLLLGWGEGEEYLLWAPPTGQPSRRGSKLWFTLAHYRFQKEKIRRVRLLCRKLVRQWIWRLGFPECNLQPPNQGSLWAQCTFNTPNVARGVCRKEYLDPIRRRALLAVVPVWGLNRPCGFIPDFLKKLVIFAHWAKKIFLPTSVQNPPSLAGLSQCSDLLEPLQPDSPLLSKSQPLKERRVASFTELPLLKWNC